MKKTIIQLLKNSTKKYTDKEYISEKGEKGWYAKTFNEADIESTNFAAGLNSLNFKKDSKIAILSEGKINWILGEFGILKIACVSVPLSIKLLPEEILFRLNHSESEAILISKNNIDKLLPVFERLENKNFKIILLDDDIETINKISEKLNLQKDKQIFIFNELKTKGKKLLENNPQIIKNIETEIQENDVVSISYTSGTTGNPKGIMLTHLNYFSNCNSAYKFFNNLELYQTLIILPLDHSFAHTVGIYIALIGGMKLYFVDARGGNMNLLKNIPINIKEVKPQFLLSVPALTSNFMKKIDDGIKQKGKFLYSIFKQGIKSGIIIKGNGYNKVSFAKKLFNYLPYKFADILIFKKVRQIFGGRLEFFVGGGALLDINQQNFFQALGVHVYQGYGLTEATPIISANRVSRYKLGTSGMVLEGMTCKIVDAEGKQCKTGEKGEIIIKGENVMKGYYKNQKASDEVLKDGWLYTGDMGYYEKDGFLMVVGREKALLISQDGEKYSPEEIEEAIVNTSDLISQVMLYNDHSKNTTALITLDNMKIKALIKQNNINSSEQLLLEIKQSFYQFSSEKVYKNKFPTKWIPTNFTIIEEQFSEKNKMINSTMKMVRYKITETYQEHINQMYELKTNLIVQKNKEIIKKLFL